jgi:hypothetical protein
MMAASALPSSDEKRAESSLALKTSTLSPDISAERVSLFFKNTFIHVLWNDADWTCRIAKIHKNGRQQVHKSK